MESTKTRPKNRGKSCFFHCFRPNHMDYQFGTKSFQAPRTTDPLLTYIAVSEKEGIMFPTILSSAVAKGGGSRRRKKTNDGFLRQALNATLSETLWGKKIINFRRKTNKDSIFRSNRSNLEGESDKISNTECKITHLTNSNISASPAFAPSLLSSSTTTSSSISLETQAWNSSSELCSQPKSVLINGINGVITKQKQDFGDSRKGYYYGPNMAVCLPLISLVALIFWGKFCAILCTSILLFVVPPRTRKPCHEGALCGEIEFDSVQYKKKIIMEGLLERRSRSHCRV